MESAAQIKAVRIALGPNPTCDPYPPKEFENGADLFNKRYAGKDEYKHITDFTQYMKENPKDAFVLTVTREFTEENLKNKAIVAKWREKWPEHAKIVDAAREKASSSRKKRKRAEKEKAAALAAAAAAPGATTPNTTTKHHHHHAGYQTLTSKGEDSIPGWVDEAFEYLRKCRADAAKFMYGIDEVQSQLVKAVAFMTTAERDREHIF